jgi:chromosome segregation ATPase
MTMVSEVGLDCLSHWIEDCSGLFYSQLTKMEQIIERLLAKMDSLREKIEINKEKMDAWKGEIRADLKTQIDCLTSHTDVNKEKVDALLKELKA